MRGTPPVSACPLARECPRWTPGSTVPRIGDPDAELGSDDAWPCTRLLDLLDPEVNWVGRRRSPR